MRWVWASLIATSLMSTIGCEGQSQETWGYLEIIYSWSEIGKAKKLAEKSQVRPLSAEALEEASPITRALIPEDMPPKKALQRVLKVLLDPQTSANARAKAFVLLRLIEPTAAEAALLKALQKSEDESARELMVQLCLLHEDGMQFSNAPLANHLKSQIENETLGLEAARICARYEIPGFARALGGAFSKVNNATKVEILVQLAEKRPSPKVVEVCVETLPSLVEENRLRCFSALDTLVQSQNAAAHQAACDALAQELTALIRAGKTDWLEFPHSSCIELLRNGTGEKVRAFADLAELRLQMPFLAQCKYVFERRSEGAAGWERIQQDLRDPETMRLALDAAKQIYGDSKDQQILEIVRNVASAVEGDEQRFTLAMTLLALGGETAIADVRRLMPKLPIELRGYVKDELNAWQPEKLAQHLAESGLIQAQSPSAYVAHVVAQRKGPAAEEDPRRVSLEELLAASGLITEIDYAFGVFPTRHDKVLLKLAARSSGEFQPEYCSERVKSIRKDATDAPYLVQFVHDDRLYRFTARNFDGQPDMERVIAVCNQALRDDGSEYEFRTTAGFGDSSVWCVTPEQADLLTREFDVLWMKDLEAQLEEEKSPEMKIIEHFSKQR